MIGKGRSIAALATTGAAFLFGLALGERGELGAVQWAFLAGIPVATAILATFARHARMEVIAGGLAMFSGVALGQAAFARAFEECRTKAPLVRAQIEQHRARHDEFPAHLTNPPCRCILRPTILHYAHGERSYRLWYTNDFVTHSATHKSAFP